MAENGKRRSVRRGRLDYEANCVTIGVGNKQRRYSGADLAAHVHRYLILLGLKTALLMTRDADANYALLLAGTVPETRPAAVPRVSKWRTAIAHTLASFRAHLAAPKGSKKSMIEQMTMAELPAMQEHVNALPRDRLRKLMARADVQETYRRLFGAKPSDMQTSIFEIAGVMQPPLTSEIVSNGEVEALSP